MFTKEETESRRNWLGLLETGNLKGRSPEEDQREMMFLRREIAVYEAWERWHIETCQHRPSLTAYIQEAKRNTPVPPGY